MKSYAICAALLLLVSCGRGETGASGGPAAPQSAAEGSERQELRISADMQQKWGITLGHAALVNAASKVTLPGVLSVNQQRTAHISAILPGRVVSVGVDLGAFVRRGQVLVVIHSPALAQAKTAFLQARARLNLTRKEYDRAKNLLKEQALDQKEYLRREAEHDSASTDYGVAESNLHSFGMDQAEVDALVRRYGELSDDTRLDELTEPRLNVVSPIDGRIIFRDVTVGEHVAPEKILFTASDLTTLWAQLDARENDLADLRVGSAVAIRTSAYPDRSFPARITYVSDVVDEKLRTIKVRAEVTNAGTLLKPNMYVEGVIENGAVTRQELVVPDDAVQTINGEPAVFVLERPGVFVVRPVEVGEKIGSNRAVTKGLEATETVALTGAFNLKAEFLKATFADEGEE